jgi:hypothetical protein
MRLASALAILLIIVVLAAASQAGGSPPGVLAQMPTPTPTPTATATGILPPTRFWGTLTINGAPAPTGARVTALIDGLDCGSRVTTSDGQYWVDAISADEQPGCGTSGSRVDFRVNGLLLSLGSSWHAGHFVNLDLVLGSSTTPP